jgi:UDPglucose 6-dehydrogenase
MKVCVFGTGYVGLVQGAVLAEAGHTVTCVDIDPEKIWKLNLGEISIFEPGLDTIVRSNLTENRLNFTTDAQDGMQDAEVIFIAVGTPMDEDGSADLTHVLNVAQTVGTHITRPVVVVNKSTVPVGTADKVQKCISEQLKLRKTSVDFDVVSNCVSFMSRSIATTTKSLSWMCEAQSSPNTLPIACLLRESVS